MQIRATARNSGKREVNQVQWRYQNSGNNRIVQTQTREMVNGLHLYSAFIQSALQFLPLIHPFTHTFTHIHTPTAIGCHARYQPARQEQLGVRCLAQGHFDTPRVGSNRQPSDCQTTALPPEPTTPTVMMVDDIAYIQDALFWKTLWT